MQTTRVWFLTHNHKPQSQTPSEFLTTPCHLQLPLQLQTPSSFADPLQLRRLTIPCHFGRLQIGGVGATNFVFNRSTSFACSSLEIF